MFPTLYILGSVQAIFLALLIIGKKRKIVSDYVLAIWLFLLGMHLVLIYLFSTENLSIYLWRINAGFSFLQGPFLYFYARFLLGARFFKGLLLHTVPFFFYVFSINALYSFWIDSFQLLVLLSLGSYVFLSYTQLERYQTTLKENSAQLLGHSLNWLKILTLSIGFICLIIFLDFIIPDFLHSQPGHNPIFVTLSIVVFIIGYFGLMQGNIISYQELKKNKDKYSTSSLTTEKLKEIKDILDKEIFDKELFLNEDLSLSLLSSIMDMKENHISQALGHHNTYFYRYINSFRLQRTIKLINENKAHRFTIFGLAMDSGFKSKATFNRFFKKEMNMTPTEYIKKLKN